MPELGRAALAATLGLVLYAVVAGAWAAHTRRRRLALSAQNALIGAFATTAVAALVLLAALVRHDFSFVYVAQHTSRELPDRVHDLGLLGRAGGVAAALAARPDRLCGGRGPAQPAPCAGHRRVGRPGARRSRSLLLVPARRGRHAVRDADGTHRRRGPESEPPEPVHAGPSAAPLPGLRRPDCAVRVRDGRAARAAGGRALDRLDPPLDALRVDGTRRRPAARGALGVSGGRLGRLLRLGSRRERSPDALARSDGVPALGDDPGEARDAAGLERPARRACLRALALRHVPDALRDSQLDPLVHGELDRALVPRLHLRDGVRLAGARVRAPAAAARPHAPGVARARARRPSSTTTCCSSR